MSYILNDSNNNAGMKPGEADVNIGPHGGFYYYLLFSNPFTWISLLIALIPVVNYLFDGAEVWHFLIEWPAGKMGLPHDWILWAGLLGLSLIFSILPSRIVYSTTRYTFHSRINTTARSGENPLSMYLDIETFSFGGSGFGQNNDSIAYSLISDCDIHVGAFEMMCGKGNAGTLLIASGGTRGGIAKLKRIKFVRFPESVRTNIMENCGAAGARMIA
jgi:hypothetical protein